MNRELGKSVACPQCNGVGKVNEKSCPVCHGDQKVEYQERDGYTSAPAGSWFPLKRRGQSGYIICLFGNAIQEVRR